MRTSARGALGGGTDPTEGLRTFRRRLHVCLCKRKDGLFELIDAILTGDGGPSPVHLSLAPVHRRGWGSLYAALSKGTIDAEALRELLASHSLGNGGTKVGAPVYAVDVTSWPRSDAETSPERGYYYHPSRHSAGQPIVAGWAYQLLAEIGLPVTRGLRLWTSAGYVPLRTQTTWPPSR